MSYVDRVTGGSYTSTLLEAVAGCHTISQRMVHYGTRKILSEINHFSLEPLENQVAKDRIRTPTREHLHQDGAPLCPRWYGNPGP